MWWLSAVDGCVWSRDEIVDMAWEGNGKVLYVLFNDDNHLYRYDGIQSMVDSEGKISIGRGSATMILETMHSVSITDKELSWRNIFIDDGEWSIVLFGTRGDRCDVETWSGSPGYFSDRIQQFNTIVFGDSLFDAA